MTLTLLLLISSPSAELCCNDRQLVDKQPKISRLSGIVGSDPSAPGAEKAAKHQWSQVGTCFFTLMFGNMWEYA